MVSQLRNVAEELAEGVSQGLGMKTLPEPQPRVLRRPPKPEVERSEALSLFARAGNTGIATRRIAILVADGAGESAAALHEALSNAGAVPRFIGPKMGPVEAVDGTGIDVEISLEAGPSVLWDAVAVPEGSAAALTGFGQALEFLKDQYRHCKPMLFLGDAEALLDEIKVPDKDRDADGGLIVAADLVLGLDDFTAAIAQHRHFNRETDPPRI
jgi:catalase